MAHLLRLYPAVEGWQEDRLMLSAALDDFDCLGSDPQQAGSYGCHVGPIEALRDLAADVDGAIEFDHLTTSIPVANLSTHAPTVTSGEGAA